MREFFEVLNTYPLTTLCLALFILILWGMFLEEGR